jgi:hypothetical protein
MGKITVKRIVGRRPVTQTIETKNVKMLPIRSCLGCPHHGIERDPSSSDSFDFQDTALVCRLAKVPRDQRPSDMQYTWKQPARRILGYSRGPEKEYRRNGEKIPDWCPL